MGCWSFFFFSVCLGVFVAGVLGQQAHSTLTQSIIEYGNTSSEIDLIQRSFSCCGVDGPKSWQLNRKFNCSSANGVCGVPRSCCVNGTNTTCGFYVWQNETLSANIFEDGCLSTIEYCLSTDYGTILLVFTVFFVSFYMLLAFLFASRCNSLLFMVEQYRASLLLIKKVLYCYCICAHCRNTSRVDEGNIQPAKTEMSLTDFQTSFLDDDSSASHSEEKNSTNSSLNTGWRLVCGCCRFRQSSDSESGVSSSEALPPSSTSLDANDEDNPITNGDDVPLLDLPGGDEIPLLDMYAEDNHVPVEQPLEVDRLHRSSVAGPETISRTVESPMSVGQVIRDLKAAIAEVGKTILEAIGTKSALSSAFMSEDDREVLPIGELALTVGPDGGNAHRGDLSLFVPAGAVDADVTLMARLYTSKHKFPHVDISKEEFIFSPVLSLEPQGYQFKKPVLVRCPFSAVPGGWRLGLLRADCRVEQAEKTWKEIVSYNTDTGEVTTNDCQFDVDHALLGVMHFCHHCWYGKAILNQGISYIKRRKLLYCSVFGQPNGCWNRWYLELNLHDRCDDIFEGVVAKYKRLKQPWQHFGGPELLTIARYGEFKCEVKSRSWRLDGDIKPPPFEHYWNEWFGNNNNKFGFAIECPHEKSLETIGGINIIVHGCDNTASATFFVVPKISQGQVPSMNLERCGSTDSGTQSDIEPAEVSSQSLFASSSESMRSTVRATNQQSHVATPEHYQASMPQPTREYNPGPTATIVHNYNISHVAGPVVAGLRPSQITTTRPVENALDQAALCGDVGEVGQLAGSFGEIVAPAADSEGLDSPKIAEGEDEEDW